MSFFVARHAGFDSPASTVSVASLRACALLTPKGVRSSVASLRAYVLLTPKGVRSPVRSALTVHRTVIHYRPFESCNSVKCAAQ